ncbi:MAG: zf-HC2 domain-containing protein [Acidobacteriota bacterium]
MHIDQALLHAFRDEELSPAEQSRVLAHLTECDSCREALEAARARARHTAACFEILDSGSVLPTAASLRNRIQQRIETRMEITNMWQKPFSRKYRPVWASLFVLAVVTVLLMVPPVRALAGRFLYLFRAQEIQTVYVDGQKLEQQMRKLRSSPEMAQILAKDLRVEPKGERHAVASTAEAAQEAGIQVRVPRALQAVKWYVQPGAKISMDVDLARVRAVMDEMGNTDIELPPALDGAKINFDLQASVVGFFGDCSESAFGLPGEAGRRLYLGPGCFMLTQALSPTVSAPGGLNIDEVATPLLQVMGMTESEAREFSQTVDFTTTMLVPIPRNVSSAEIVMVDGVKGNLIRYSGSERFLLIWIKNETIYSLNGVGDKAKALEIAGSLA